MMVGPRLPNWVQNGASRFSGGPLLNGVLAGILARVILASTPMEHGRTP